MIPILDEKYVGKRLVKEFVQKKEICFIYQYEAILFRVFDWLPSGLIDWIQAHLVISDFKPIRSNKEEEKPPKKYKWSSIIVMICIHLIENKNQLYQLLIWDFLNWSIKLYLYTVYLCILAAKYSTLFVPLLIGIELKVQLDVTILSSIAELKTSYLYINPYSNYLSMIF